MVVVLEANALTHFLQLRRPNLGDRWNADPLFSLYRFVPVRDVFGRLPASDFLSCESVDV